MRARNLWMIAVLSCLLAGCERTPDIEVGKYPDIDVNQAILFTSRDHREIQVTKIVINENNAPSCVWPPAKGETEPYASGVSQGKSMTDTNEPLLMGLGGGFALEGFYNCGQPVEVTVDTNYGTVTYQVGG